MANDRLRFFCKTCRKRSPTLAVYAVTEIDWFAEPKEVSAWLSEHLLFCRKGEDTGTLGADSGFLLITEAQDRDLPQPDS